MGNLFQSPTLEDQVQELKFNVGMDVKHFDSEIEKLDQKTKKIKGEIKSQLSRTQGELSTEIKRKAKYVQRMEKTKAKLSDIKASLQSIELEADTVVATARLTSVATEASQLWSAAGRQLPTDMVRRLAIQHGATVHSLENKLEALTESFEDTDLEDDSVDISIDWLQALSDEARLDTIAPAVYISRDRRPDVDSKHDSLAAPSSNVSNQNSDSKRT
jgi:predicted nuclease with TOPRIM domain